MAAQGAIELKSVNHARLNTNRHPWAALLAGLFTGVITFFLAQWAAAWAGSSPLPDVRPFLAQYGLSGLAWMIVSIPFVRNLVTQEASAAALVKRTLWASTTAFALFLTPTLVLSPDISARWLLYWFALSILFDWLVWRWLLSYEGATTQPRYPFLGNLPHAPFIAAGLFLLAVTALDTVLGQGAPADRTAVFAYWLLLFGVVVALLTGFQISTGLRGWSRFLPETGSGLLVLSLVVVGNYFSTGLSSPAERALLLDTYPNYLAGRIGDGDLLISDSPSLRFANLPRIGAYLDLLPDQRGLALWDDLAHALQGKRRVFWVSVPDDSGDHQQILSAFLKTNGCLDDISSTNPQVRMYELERPLARPRVLPPTLASRTADSFNSIHVDLGALQITGLAFEPRVCSHDAVAVAIRWQSAQTFPDPLKLSLLLLDPKGRQIESRDAFIVDTADQRTDQWKPGVQTPGYYLIPVPFGTPPGNYTLAGAVYRSSDAQRLSIKAADGVQAQGNEIIFGQVQVYRSEDLQADPFKTRGDAASLPAQVSMGDGLVLDAYQVGNTSVIPGESLSVIGLWRAAQGGLPSYTLSASVRQGENLIAETSSAPADGTYPTNEWRAQESVLDRRDVHIPAEANGGSARVEIGVDGARSVYVADVIIMSIAHTFTIPSMGHAARATIVGIGDLIGYGLDHAQISTADSLGMTLYWRAANAIDEDYAVFVQLLGTDGHLIAQSDSMPANGQRPTRSWIKGEIVSDPHELQFVDKSYTGDAKLIVGFYNPMTLQRITVKDSPDDYVTLPAPVRILSP